MLHASLHYMTPRSHTALRLAALAWILAIGLLPRGLWAGFWGPSPGATASATHVAAQATLE
jgi:hypothetical protein